jgi:uncharacterized protein (TIGR02145 family)
MKTRTTYTSVISIAALTVLALCGILLTHCKKFEVSAEVIVTIEGISEITGHSCRAAGMLVDVGSTGVAQHGFCWSLTPNPAQAIDCQLLGRRNDRGGFSDIIEGFTPGTEYYIYAFAENEDGRKYSVPTGFSTIAANLPTVHTHLIEERSHNTAVVSGSISDDGGDEIFEKGVCSNVHPNPTVETNVLHADGGNPDPFELTIVGLVPNTTYFVRAFASNAAGTAYGENQEFRTLPEFGEMVDERNGKHYQTVQIGEMTWMAQNLDIGEMIAVTTNASNNDIIEKYCYNNDPGHCETFGGLYTWDEMMQYTIDSPHGVCPDGWHVPSDEEWRNLEMILGLSEEATHIEGQRGADINAGGKLKTPDELWDTPNVGATDEIGFHALPAGMLRESDEFLGIGKWSPFWTSTGVESDAFLRGVAFDHADIFRGTSPPEAGYSVRCVKD